MNNFVERLSDVDELDKQTKGWRDEVREMSYDIEDIVDDFKQQIGEKGGNSGIVNNTIERLKTLIVRHQIASQIKDIKKLVLETSKRHKRYDHHIPPTCDVSVDQRVVGLYANSTDLVGLEGPTNELVKQLKDDDTKLKVVSIVGFGGLGKTTLANEVYRRLKSDFDCSAFVPMSQKPNIAKLLGSLLTQLVGSKSHSHDIELNVLLDELREHLQSKRYFMLAICVFVLYSLPLLLVKIFFQIVFASLMWRENEICFSGKS
jgi:disease resistance protein RPM1